jgi:2-phosphoglycerate kinase
MEATMENVRAILIGGTSHSGKSTVAREIARRHEYSYVTADKLARHPGRPWRAPGWEVPPHVVKYYESLSLDDLISSVLAHYERLWPRIEELVAEHANGDGTGIVLEGSALWPTRVATLRTPATRFVWLSSASDVLRTRMYINSGHESLDEAEQRLVDRFLARALRYQQLMLSELDRLGLRPIDVAQSRTPGDVTADVMESITRGTTPRTP